jgi:cytochrome c553
MKHLRASALLVILSATSPAQAQAGAQQGTQGDAAKARPMAESVCAACHGVDGNSPIPVNPSLAGQHPGYLYKQLTDFKAGRRKNAAMSAMVANLSDDDLRNLAAYFAAQKPMAGTAKDRELVAAGQRLYRGGNSETGVPACSGCHSPDGAGVPAQYPRVAGQHGDYTVAQLQSFRNGDRDNDPNAMMRMIASRLNDKDMAAVAQYITGLR